MEGTAVKKVSPETRIRLRNILWTTDFSSPSEAALLYATSIARRYDSQMYMAHVIRPDAYQLVPPEAFGAALEQTRRYAEQQMGELLISGRLRGIPHQVLLGEGDLWVVLSDMLAKHGVDLIVAGTHGRTGVRKLLLGSVAEEIFRLAPCPVLTVGPKVIQEVPAESELRHILYATDFTPTAERAAALRYRWRKNTRRTSPCCMWFARLPKRLRRTQLCCIPFSPSGCVNWCRQKRRCGVTRRWRSKPARRPRGY